ncbi:MAG: prepilin-type N-terminal cleavage/methylation domain-containing protein [Actinomycetota bacterium]|nr:prepilin-type N-terminal cleavage/methylation domain-containing protein [Actinomycetota bacterium]
MQLETRSIQSAISTVNRIRSFLAVRSSEGRLNDDGLTLVELLVASALFSFILVMTLNLVNTFEVSRSNIAARSNNTGTAMSAMNEITRNLRNAINLSSSATPLAFVSPAEVKFTTFDQSTNSTKSLDIIATPQAGGSCPCSLYENESSPTTSSLLLATNLTSNQIFTFASGTTTDGKTLSLVSVPISGTDLTTTLSQIAVIDITLNVSQLNSATSATLSQTVALSNVINGTNTAYTYQVANSFSRSKRVMA